MPQDGHPQGLAAPDLPIVEPEKKEKGADHSLDSPDADAGVPAPPVESSSLVKKHAAEESMPPNQSLDNESLENLPEIESKEAKKKQDVQYDFVDLDLSGWRDSQWTESEHATLDQIFIERRMKAEEEKQEEVINPDEDDNMTARTFARIVELMPFWDGDTPPAFTIVPSIIRCSSILDRAAELLRHSTLEELAGKTELYQKLHEFICALVKRPSTAVLVLEDRIAHRPGHTISKVVHGLPTPGISEMSASSFTRCMRALAKMADAELNSEQRRRRHW
ncbi:hypothetical protein AC578_3225 [Pseudocercospora eumusae]|uniref:Uncharacterized protein n=1 Tax=Pseudocercospora eumusae TaxID=321146 RepID=A0A139H1V6_9PEZI|nr:hypothetical protein AC578_3225 [Pseudocercospora eumusae]